MEDPVVEEVRRAQDAHARQFNCDLDAICEDLQKPEKPSAQPIVSLPPQADDEEGRSITVTCR